MHFPARKMTETIKKLINAVQVFLAFGNLSLESYMNAMAKQSSWKVAIQV